MLRYDYTVFSWSVYDGKILIEWCVILWYDL